MTKLEDRSLQNLLRRVWPVAQLEILPPLQGSENRHARVTPPESEPLFIKFYAHRDKFEVERAVLNAGQGGSYFLPAIASDETSDPPWLALPWLDLKPTVLDGSTARSYGKLLAELHNLPSPPGLKLEDGPLKKVLPRLECLKSWPSLYDRSSHLWEQIQFPLTKVLVAYDTPAVLLQNDFGARNVYRREDDHLILIDFERAGLGDAHWDLGKIWDRELYNRPIVRTEFLASYCHTRGLSAKEWPNSAVLWLVRFVATLAIFPYAQRTQDKEFFEHGLFKLSLLEAELSSVKSLL